MQTFLFAVLVGACSTDAPSAVSQPADPTPPPSDVVRPPSPEDVARRVQDAHTRLDATEGGALLHQVIDAHGGLTAWFTSGTLGFDFDYLPQGAPERRMYTRNEVDVWSVRARQIELGDGADAVFGWDGQTAWITPGPDAFPAPAAFWATTPYYFVGIPWVLSDPGASQAAEGRMTLTDPAGGAHETDVVRVTFSAGTGQAPDDYYVLHTDPETHQVVALRYIVTDPAVRGPDSPPPRETILFYREQAPHEDTALRVAHHYDGFHWTDAGAGERKSTVDIAQVTFGDAYPVQSFSSADSAL